MPMYEYQCDNGHIFEVRQSFSDATLTVCPTCGAKIHRVIQPAGIVFKGSGFYVTDSRGKQNLTTSGEKKTNEGAGNSEGGGSDSSNGTKAEPAKTAETSSTASNGNSSSTPAAASTTSTSSNGSSDKS